MCKYIHHDWVSKINRLLIICLLNCFKLICFQFNLYFRSTMISIFCFQQHHFCVHDLFSKKLDPNEIYHYRPCRSVCCRQSGASSQNHDYIRIYRLCNNNIGSTGLLAHLFCVYCIHWSCIFLPGNLVKRSGYVCYARLHNIVFDWICELMIDRRLTTTLKSNCPDAHGQNL